MGPRQRAQLLALTGLAITQPVLDFFGRSPQSFIRTRADGLDIVLFTLLVAVVPAAVLWLAELVIGAIAGDRAQRVVHLVALAALATVVGIQLVTEVTDFGPRRVLFLAGVLAVAFVVAVTRFSVLRTWLRVLALAPVLFATMFLATSSSAELVFGREVAPVDDLVVGRPAPVVMVTFDELPLVSLLDGRGQVDGERFPNFARLAGQSTWYRNTTAAAAFTQGGRPHRLHR